jgi:hypothetical protein
VQKPDEHTAREFGPAVQALSHAPQCSRSVVVIVSQPLDALPSQSPYPGVHEATVHCPAAHPAIPLGSEQRFMHAPQFLGSFSRSEQTPRQQVAPGAQAFPQRPQLFESVRRSAQLLPQHEVPSSHGRNGLHPTEHRCDESHTRSSGQSRSPRHSTQAWVIISQRTAAPPPPSGSPLASSGEPASRPAARVQSSSAEQPGAH